MTSIARARPLLGTLVSIQATGLPRPAAVEALECAFAEIAAVHRCMSFHAPQSDLSRLHRAPLHTPIAVDERTYGVLEEALALACDSGGIFDPTIGGELVASGYLPPPRDATVPTSDVSWRDIALLGEGYVQRLRHAWIDLGGIAKGYAVDRALAILQIAGFRSAVVNAGGDLARFGPGEETIALRIGEQSAAIVLREGAVATSCIATSGSEPAHHLHGRTRQMAARIHGVSVIAPRCSVADGLTKIVLADQGSSHALLQSRSAYAYLHDDEGWRRFGVAA